MRLTLESVRVGGIVADQNNRLMPRFRKRAKVSFKTVDGVMLNGFTTDIGPGGLFINTQRALDEGLAVEVTIELAELEPVTVSGRVAWTRRVPKTMQRVEKNGFGVELTSAPPEGWYALLTAMTS